MPDKAVLSVLVPEHLDSLIFICQVLISELCKDMAGG